MRIRDWNGRRFFNASDSSSIAVYLLPSTLTSSLQMKFTQLKMKICSEYPFYCMQMCNFVFDQLRAHFHMFKHYLPHWAKKKKKKTKRKEEKRINNKTVFRCILFITSSQFWNVNEISVHTFDFFLDFFLFFFNTVCISGSRATRYFGMLPMVEITKFLLCHRSFFLQK